MYTVHKATVLRKQNTVIYREKATQ